MHGGWPDSDPPPPEIQLDPTALQLDPEATLRDALAAWEEREEKLYPYHDRDPSEPRAEPWFNFILEWEQPTRGWGHRRKRREWRNRHKRIFRLEKELGYIDDRWHDYEVFPFVGYPYEGW